MEFSGCCCGLERLVPLNEVGDRGLGMARRQPQLETTRRVKAKSAPPSLDPRAKLAWRRQAEQELAIALLAGLRQGLGGGEAEEGSRNAEQEEGEEASGPDGSERGPGDDPRGPDGDPRGPGGGGRGPGGGASGSGGSACGSSGDPRGSGGDPGGSAVPGGGNPGVSGGEGCTFMVVTAVDQAMSTLPARRMVGLRSELGGQKRAR